MEIKEPLRQKSDTDPASAAALTTEAPREPREALGEKNEAGGTALSDEELGEVVGGFLFFFF